MEGFVHPDFAPVIEKVQTLMSKRSAEGGMAVAVYHHGELVVDAWTGARDAAGTPWDRDTMSMSFSTTKGVVSTIVHRLVDQGLLDYDVPVATYWPEFAAGGKDTITLRHLLTHQAALHEVRALAESTETLLDWDAMTKLLADALREDYDITALSRAVLTKLAEAADSALLRELLGEEEKPRLKEYSDGREIIDAILEFAPHGLSAAALTGIFRKLPPRLYSIASSPLAHTDEVHLTVAAVRYQAHGRERKGVCSTFLADQIRQGDAVQVFVQPNKNFRLPADHSAPVIMVGPGTGVAPFRAFVEHRAALGSPGKNWLFFGDQHYTYDFLYQLEWQDHLKEGALTRLDVAFSRDQPDKVYVQDRMIERAKELYLWLQEGAYFYVCGDANRMADDVHKALIAIVKSQASISDEAAETYVENLKKNKRYQRDVY